MVEYKATTTTATSTAVTITATTSVSGNSDSVSGVVNEEMIMDNSNPPMYDMVLSDYGITDYSKVTGVELKLSTDESAFEKIFGSFAYWDNQDSDYYMRHSY